MTMLYTAEFSRVLSSKTSVYPPANLETTSSIVTQQHRLCKIISTVNRKRAVLPRSFLLYQDSSFYHHPRNWI